MKYWNYLRLRHRERSGLLAFAILSVYVANCLGQSSPPSPIGVSEVDSQVNLIRTELELIRKHMGRPLVTQEALPVMQADARTLYFQAETLYNKSSRLCNQFTHGTVEELPAPSQQIGIEDVFRVLSASITNIQKIKTTLRIHHNIDFIPVISERSPAELCRSIVQANRQLNLLLDSPTSPS